jgi:hypothetical protein
MLGTVVVAAAIQAAILPVSHAEPASQPAAAQQSADAVKAEFLHAWRNYEQYAWGHDDLRPLSHKPHDWYAQSLMMTPVDALDTLVVMGLKPEADKARELIATRLSFDKDIYVKNFEITIRLLGGLLSSYQLTGDDRRPGCRTCSSTSRPAKCAASRATRRKPARCCSNSAR